LKQVWLLQVSPTVRLKNSTPLRTECTYLLGPVRCLNEQD